MNSFVLLQAAQGGSSLMSILMIVALFVIFYFFMIRPQQKRQKDIQKFRDSLEAGSNVVTAGGIFGVIKEKKDQYFVVEIANGVRIRVAKESIYPSVADANQAGEQQNNK
ncbi:MAG: preprotein translocase subunit YajC [Muribaculaceae bacterium]|nr:preprotein translocase subunit YajC [Muribaculaceae bacterium]